MNIKERKKQIMKEKFPIAGMMAISMLGIVFFFILSEILNIDNYDSFYEYFSKNGFAFIFGGFFFGISICCWITFFRNIILNPKKEILYLVKNENDKSIFVNKKGKKLTIENTKKKEATFYYVIKTSDFIYEVLDEECNLNEIWEEKKNYWMNYYSPFGNFEDVFLLPIAYVILLPGLISFFMSSGWEKIFGLAWSIIPLYAIVYDFLYKIKMKKNSLNYEEEIKFANSYIYLKITIAVFFSAIMLYELTRILLTTEETSSRLMFLPFYICGIISSILLIAKVLGKDNIYKLLIKGFVIIFLIIWFGLTTFATIQVVLEGNSYGYLVIVIPFYILGIYVFKKYILEK